MCSTYRFLSSFRCAYRYVDYKFVAVEKNTKMTKRIYALLVKGLEIFTMLQQVSRVVLCNIYTHINKRNISSIIQ